MKFNKSFKYSIVCAGLLTALSATSANAAGIEQGLNYHGYVKAGFAASNDEILNQDAYDWGNTGGNIFKLPGNTYTNASGGRLGNESNWSEFHFNYGYAPKNGMNWGVNANIVYGNELALDEIYALADGVIPTNPSATFWVGKRYYNRVETVLTDSQSMSNDGVGAGMDNYDLGYGKLHLGVTRNLYDEGAQGGGYNAGGTDHAGGMLAFTSSITDIQLQDDLTLGLYLNYGTFVGSKHDQDVPGSAYNLDYDDLNPDAQQVAANFRLGDWSNWDQLFIRYSHNSTGSMTRAWEPNPEHQIGGFWEGYKELSDNVRFNYIIQHETALFDREARERTGLGIIESNWTAFVARGTYVWNERTSTEMEVGYEMIDFEAEYKSQDGTNDGYKVTLSQNLHIGSGTWDRPVMRFFVTYVDQDVETKVYDRWGIDTDDKVPMGSNDALTFGAQFEAWW